MIDIHSHIIFDVDDGPKNFEDSKNCWKKAIDREFGPSSLLLIAERVCLKRLKRPLALTLKW